MHDHGGRGGLPRSSRRRWRPRLAVLVAALALTLALTLTVAACGGNKPSRVASLSGSKQPTATTHAGGSHDDRQAALNFARCMRQHGIDLPDPQFSGDNIVQRLPTRTEQNSPKFKAAQPACRQYLPNGGQPSPPTAQERQQAVAFARCMRQHGIDVPDPKITADGIEYQFPERVRDDPRLKAAERACHQYGALPPVMSGGPQSGGGGK
jgi:hypothetical protein